MKHFDFQIRADLSELSFPIGDPLLDVGNVDSKQLADERGVVVGALAARRTLGAFQTSLEAGRFIVGRDERGPECFFDPMHGKAMQTLGEERTAQLSGFVLSGLLQHFGLDGGEQLSDWQERIAPDSHVGVRDDRNPDERCQRGDEECRNLSPQQVAGQARYPGMEHEVEPKPQRSEELDRSRERQLEEVEEESEEQDRHSSPQDRILEQRSQG